MRKTRRIRTIVDGDLVGWIGFGYYPGGWGGDETRAPAAIAPGGIVRAAIDTILRIFTSAR
jgi:hypothetical protein